MTAAETLTILATHGVNVALIGGELEIDAPDEFNTAEWCEWFGKAKAGLRAHLRQRAYFAELLETMPEAEAQRFGIEESVVAYSKLPRDKAEAFAARDWQNFIAERRAA